MDSEYLKQHVGDALTRGLVEIVQIRPSDPIEYLALWLRKYVENRDYDIKKHEDEIKLEKEREEFQREQEQKQAMEEEQQMIARQEAYEKAAAEPVVVDNTPRPMPPEVLESLPTLVEGDEEPKSQDNDNEQAKETTSTETINENQLENEIADEQPAQDGDKEEEAP